MSKASHFKVLLAVSQNPCLGLISFFHSHSLQTRDTLKCWTQFKAA